MTKEGDYMDIIEFVKESKSDYPRYSIVRVGFVNREGEEDETEFDVCENVFSKKGKQELKELWESLAPEMDAEVDAVTYVNIVDSADFPFWKDTFTREEVVSMLREMQVEAAKCNGFIAGMVSQLWVIKELLGDRLKKFGDDGIKINIV